MDLITPLLVIGAIFLISQQRAMFTQAISKLELRIITLQETIEALGLSKEPSVSKDAMEPTVVDAPELEREPLPTIIPMEDTLSVPAPIPDVESSHEFHEPAAYRKSYKPRYSEPEPRLSFFERHPDLERFIGENLANKIGIAILVLSIGFFVKYAIDSNWIGEIGRVVIGLVCAAILIGIAHKVKDEYNALSSVLVGGGLAVFYFTITLAFHQFHLFSNLTAFAILITVTVFAVALSLLYDKQELAVIALLGGFLSPFLLSTGNANYSGLFLYLLVLNVGLLVIAYYKSWRILNITTFGLTVIVFAMVLAQLTALNYHIGLVYATIFYLLYIAINIAYNVRESKRFIASDFSILLINTALYFSVGLYLLTEMHYEQFRGLFSASLGLVNLCLSYILFRNKKVDTNVLYLLIGITLTFISLTAPNQLEGNHITLFWASEAVLLYWLYLKSEIKIMRHTSQLIWVAMLISLIIDLDVVYSHGAALPIILNKGLGTAVFSAIATSLLARLVSKENIEQGASESRIPAVVFPVAATILFFGRIY